MEEEIKKIAGIKIEKRENNQRTIKVNIGTQDRSIFIDDQKKTFCVSTYEGHLHMMGEMENFNKIINILKENKYKQEK